MAHRCARRDAQRVGEVGGWRLPGELAPGGQPARPGRDAELVEHADEPAVAAVFAGELPGKQPRRGRVGCRSHVGAVAQVLPQQGGNGLRHVEPVRAELEPGGAVGAGGIGRPQRGDRADLLAVERHEAAGDAVAASRASGPGGQASAPTVLITGTSMLRMMRCWRAQDKKVMTCRRVVGPVPNHASMSCWVHSPRCRPRPASQARNAIATVRLCLARWQGRWPSGAAAVPPDRRWRSRRQWRNRSSSWRCPALPMAPSLAAAQRWKRPGAGRGAAARRTGPAAGAGIPRRGPPRRHPGRRGCRACGHGPGPVRSGALSRLSHNSWPWFVKGRRVGGLYWC